MVQHLRTSVASLRVQVIPSTNPDLRCLLVFHDDRDSYAAARRYRLTNRERDVLLLATGQTADAVARRLQLSPRTVHKYLERIYSKLDVHDRLSAVVRAQQLGILDQRPHSAGGAHTAVVELAADDRRHHGHGDPNERII
jgi:DNA-binding NarL/FixJ family response regulator